MATYINEPAHTFNEYLLIPGYTSCENIPANVSLKTPLVKFKKGEKPAITLNIPMVSAIMQAVSGEKLAVELAKKNGAKIICITHSYHSPIAKLADYIICSPAPETPLLGRNASARILQLTLLDAFFVSVAQLNIEQANINMQKTGAIVDFFSPGALK